jgi:enoyl-CoA hydratase
VNDDLPTIDDTTFKVLRTARHEENSKVLIVEIDNPASPLNLFDFQTMQDLARLWGVLRHSNDVWAVMLTASGDYFCAGGAFEVMEAQKDPALVDYTHRLLSRLYGDMLDNPVPVVCALNGPALGAGGSIALLSDIRFASSRVSFSDPHVQRGLTAGMGVGLWSVFLGPARSKRFLLTGETITAQQAYELGMIDFLVDADSCRSEALKCALEIAAQPPLAVAHTKMLANRLIKQTLDVTYSLGAAWEAQDFHTNDHVEAVTSFREKRPGVYKGC